MSVQKPNFIRYRVKQMARAFCYSALLIPTFACAPLETKKIKLGEQLKLQAGIIGYWAFDELSAGTALNGKDFNDLTGAGHAAVATGGLSIGTHGIKDAGVTSSGTGGVTVPIDLSGDNVITISLWVNPHITSTNAHNILFEYTPDATVGNGFFASLDDNSGTPLHSLLLWLHGPTGTFAQTSSLSLTGWHNFIATFDRSNSSQNVTTLYIDGSLISTSVYGGLNTSDGNKFANSNLYFLCRGGTTSCLKADLDEVVMWNRKVTPEEILFMSSF